MMKRVIFAFLILGLVAMPSNVEAQASRRKARNIRVAKRVNKKVRRTNRRVARRTLATLPVGTRAVVYRSKRYYPVRGMYFVARNNAYQRIFPPVGFRVARLTANAIRLSVRNQAYFYEEGVFYQEAEGEYQIVPAPVGAVIEKLPEDAAQMETTENDSYILNNVVYTSATDGYMVSEVLPLTEAE